MKPHICCICNQSLGKNFRICTKKAGPTGGWCHYRCLEQDQYNRHEAYVNRKRNIKQTHKHQDRMRARIMELFK